MLLPDRLPYEQAAPIFCASYTVWSGPRLAAPQRHERVAVMGIGGLGRLARQPGADEVVRDGSGFRQAGGADVLLHTSNSYEGLPDLIEAL
jgi:hypothetical protein